MRIPKSILMSFFCSLNSKDVSFYHCSLNSRDLFLSLRVFGLLSSSLLLFPQHFGRYVLQLYSSVCQTREPSRNFELCPLFKCCGNNNKDEDNSLKTLNDTNHQSSSQIFRQLVETLSLIPTMDIIFQLVIEM